MYFFRQKAADYSPSHVAESPATRHRGPNPQISITEVSSMAGKPITRAKKQVADARRAERAANGGKRIIRNPTPAKKREEKKAKAAEAIANGNEVDFAGFTKETWRDFMEEYMRTGRQDKACKKSGIPRQTVYKRTRQDVDFAALMEEARNICMDSLEDAAIRRSRDGWLEPQYFKGELQGYVRKYSDSLLQFMLVNGRPEKYRPKKESDITLTTDPAKAAPIINLTLNRPAKGK